jgi:hypothetical protein
MIFFSSAGIFAYVIGLMEGVDGRRGWQWCVHILIDDLDNQRQKGSSF